MQNYKFFTEKPKVNEDLDDMTIDDIREDAPFDDYDHEDDDDDFPGTSFYHNIEDLY